MQYYTRRWKVGAGDTAFLQGDHAMIVETVDITEACEAELWRTARTEKNHIVFGGRAPLKIGCRLWDLMWQEFQRNGGRMLTRGKVRYLRRIARRRLAQGADAGADHYCYAARRTFDLGVLTPEEIDLIDNLGTR